MNFRLLFIKADADDNSNTKRQNLKAIMWLLLEILLNVLFGLTPFVDNFCHLGGLLYGTLSGWSTLEPLTLAFFGVPSPNLGHVRRYVARYFGVIISSLFIVVTAVWLATTDPGTSPCQGCRYISCVPFPFWKDDKWWYCDDCQFVTARFFRTVNEDMYYDRVEVTCPNLIVESIDIADKQIDSWATLETMVPSLCRSYCDDVFV
jgi:hypothetical protein